MSIKLNKPIELEPVGTTVAGELPPVDALLGISDPKLKHHFADRAGVVSHSSNGQPLPVDTRIMNIPAEKAAEFAKEISKEQTP